MILRAPTEPSNIWNLREASRKENRLALVRFDKRDSTIGPQDRHGIPGNPAPEPTSTIRCGSCREELTLEITIRSSGIEPTSSNILIRGQVKTLDSSRVNNSIVFLQLRLSCSGERAPKGANSATSSSRNIPARKTEIHIQARRRLQELRPRSVPPAQGFGRTRSSFSLHFARQGPECRCTRNRRGYPALPHLAGAPPAVLLSDISRVLQLCLDRLQHAMHGLFSKTRTDPDRLELRIRASGRRIQSGRSGDRRRPSVRSVSIHARSELFCCCFAEYNSQRSS